MPSCRLPLTVQRRHLLIIVTGLNIFRSGASLLTACIVPCVRLRRIVRFLPPLQRQHSVRVVDYSLPDGVILPARGTKLRLAHTVTIWSVTRCVGNITAGGKDRTAVETARIDLPLVGYMGSDKTDSFLIIAFVFAAAGESLTAATRATLNVAAHNVKLPLDNSTIAARMIICAPVSTLFPVTFASILLTANDAGGMFLRLLNLLRPSFDHA